MLLFVDGVNTQTPLTRLHTFDTHTCLCVYHINEFNEISQNLQNPLDCVRHM